MKETNGNISHKDGLLTFLAPLLKVALPLLQNILTLLAKTVLVSLKLTAGASATVGLFRRTFLDHRLNGYSQMKKWMI